MNAEGWILQYEALFMVRSKNTRDRKKLREAQRERRQTRKQHLGRARQTIRTVPYLPVTK